MAMTGMAFELPETAARPLSTATRPTHIGTRDGAAPHVRPPSH